MNFYEVDNVQPDGLATDNAGAGPCEPLHAPTPPPGNNNNEPASCTKPKPSRRTYTYDSERPFDLDELAGDLPFTFDQEIKLREWQRKFKEAGGRGSVVVKVDRSNRHPGWISVRKWDCPTDPVPQDWEPARSSVIWLDPKGRPNRKAPTNPDQVDATTPGGSCPAVAQDPAAPGPSTRPVGMPGVPYLPPCNMPPCPSPGGDLQGAINELLRLVSGLSLNAAIRAASGLGASVHQGAARSTVICLQLFCDSCVVMLRVHVWAYCVVMAEFDCICYYCDCLHSSIPMDYCMGPQALPPQPHP